MDFISITFLFYYLPAALLVYYILPDGKQKTFLTLASLFFYAWGGTWFLFVTIISLAIDYWLANTSTKFHLLIAPDKLQSTAFNWHLHLVLNSFKMK